MKSLPLVFAVVLTFALATFASAQTPPASAPASQPAPRKLVIPPGFKLITVNGRNALAEPLDVPWVTTALGKIPAMSKASTQPATYLQKLAENRESIIRQMMADVSTNDPAPLAHGYDYDLTPAMKKLDDLHPPIFFLVTTPDRLSAIMKAGWQDPHFYYNRAADSVSFSLNGALTTDHAMDDIAVPTMYDVKEDADKHGDSLVAQVSGFEASIAKEVDMRARVVLGSGFAQIINNTAFEPLKPKEDQVWFGVGVASLLSAKYAAMITGEPRQQLVGALIYEHPQAPLKMSAIDLLHPTDIKTLRPEMIPAYLDTVRRKSCRAIEYMVEKGGGDSAIAKASAAFRDKKPADGPALVKVVQEASGVDLTPAM